VFKSFQNVLQVMVIIAALKQLWTELQAVVQMQLLSLEAAELAQQRCWTRKQLVVLGC